MNYSISNSVGNNAVNSHVDVQVVQTLLNKQLNKLKPMLPIVADGICGPITIGAIVEFQRRVAGFLKPDGRVDLKGRTFTLLVQSAISPEPSIKQAVGQNAPNNREDTRMVQELLNQHIPSLTTLQSLIIDGLCGQKTINAINAFQSRVLKFSHPDGRVDPVGRTFSGLLAAPRHGAFTKATNDLIQAQIQAQKTKIGKTAEPPQSASKSLRDADYQQAATTLGVEVAVIKAVATVESRGNGFLSNGKPKILFEGHWFSKFTKGQYDKSHPKISYQKWTKAHYRGGTAEYSRYNTAYALDATAAMKSTSWGKFQIMGFNSSKCGYGSDVKKFVDDMYKSEGLQLMAFVRFIQSTGLNKHLKARNWAAFARGYNGPGYAQNKYDVLMKQAYEAFSSSGR